MPGISIIIQRLRALPSPGPRRDRRIGTEFPAITSAESRTPPVLSRSIRGSLSTALGGTGRSAPSFTRGKPHATLLAAARIRGRHSARHSGAAPECKPNRHQPPRPGLPRGGGTSLHAAAIDCTEALATRGSCSTGFPSSGCSRDEVSEGLSRIRLDQPTSAGKPAGIFPREKSGREEPDAPARGIPEESLTYSENSSTHFASRIRLPAGRGRSRLAARSRTPASRRRVAGRRGRTRERTRRGGRPAAWRSRRG